jgi:hypothetical protein
MPAPKLHWDNAEVSDGVLTVPVDGDRPKGWDGVFERTVTLLGSGQWDEVKLKSGKVRVKGVQPGVEETLHHFLEGVVQEANAVAGTDEEDEGDGRTSDDDGDPEDGDGDAQLTARFRQFAGPDASTDKDSDTA